MDLKTIALSTLVTGAIACSPKTYLPINVGNTSGGEEIPAAGPNQEDIDRILDARQFGFENLGFNSKSPHYGTYRPGNTSIPSKTLNILVVSQQDNLPEDIGPLLSTEQHRKIVYPYIPTQGYFSSVSLGVNETAKKRLQKIEDVYKEQGYHTFLLSTDNFHDENYPLGASVTPDFLKLSPVEQVQNIYRLSCHYTVGSWPGNFPGELEDSLCKVLELEGTKTYFKERKGESSEEFRQVSKYLTDFRKHADNVNGFYEGSYADGVNTAKLALFRPETRWFTLFSGFYDSHKNVKSTLAAMEECPEYESEGILHVRDNWPGLSYSERIELTKIAQELRWQEENPPSAGLKIPEFSTQKKWEFSGGKWKEVKQKKEEGSKQFEGMVKVR